MLDVSSWLNEILRDKKCDSIEISHTQNHYSITPTALALLNRFSRFMRRCLRPCMEIGEEPSDHCISFENQGSVGCKEWHDYREVLGVNRARVKNQVILPRHLWNVTSNTCIVFPHSAPAITLTSTASFKIARPMVTLCWPKRVSFARRRRNVRTYNSALRSYHRCPS